MAVSEVPSDRIGRGEKDVEMEEARLASIIDADVNPSYISDPQTYGVLFANRAFVVRLGEPRGRKCFEYIYQRSSPCPFCTNSRILGDNIGKVHIWTNPNLIGGRLFQCIDRAVAWSDGQFARYETAVDVTEQEISEQTLHRSESKYRSLFENIPEAFQVIELIYDGGDPVDWRYIEINPTFEQMFGLKGDQIIGRTAKQIFGEAESNWLDHYNGVIRSGQASTFTDKGATTGKWFEVHAWKVGGNSCAAVFSDVTARKEANDAVKESEGRLRALIEGAPLAITMARGGVTTLVNSRYLKMFGYSSLEEVRDRSIADRLTPPDYQRVLEALLKLENKTLDVTEFEITGVRKDGTTFPFHAAYTTVLLPDGLATLGFLIDITDRKRAEEALSESEAKYRLLINNAIDAILVIQDGLFRLVNPIAHQLVGTTDEDILGKPFMPFVHPADIGLVRSRYLSRIKGEDVPTNYDFRIIRKDGKQRWVTISSTVIDWEGRPATLNSLRDITERKNAVRLIEKNEKKYRLLAENTGDVIWTMNADREKFTYISPSIIKLSGYSVKEALRFTMEETLDPSSYQHFHAQLLDWIAKYEAGDESVKSHVSTIKQRHKDGRLIVTDVATTLLKNGDGKVTRVLGISRDVTARVKAEEALKSRTEMIEAFFGMSLDLWCVVSMDGQFLVLNKGWTDTFGYAVEEMKSKSLLDLVHPDDVETTRAHISTSQEGMEVRRFVNRCRRSDGQYLWVEWNSVRKGDRLFAAARDITERKAIEDALHEAYRKLNILTSITRHDVNNQLTTLAGNLELLESMKLGAIAEQRVRRSKATVESISSMIRFTRLYEELGIAAPVWQQLRTMVDQSTADLHAGKVRIINDVPSGIEIYADALLPKVFYNLAHNALEHGDHITTIRFSVMESEDGHAVVVEDDGTGIPPQTKERLFMKGAGKDHGFGLYLSKEILAITGIDIREVGTSGKGARFELTVPEEAWMRTLTTAEQDW